MGLLKKKCEYCKEKIDRGSEVFRDMKDPVFVGVRRKAFCDSGCAEAYMEEVNLKKCGSGCCG